MRSPTFELTGRRDFIQPSPDQSRCKRRNRRSGPTICSAAFQPSVNAKALSITAIIRVAATAISLAATRSPNTHALIARTGGITTSSNHKGSAKRHNLRINHLSPLRQELNHDDSRPATVSLEQIQSEMREAANSFNLCSPTSHRTMELTRRETTTLRTSCR